MPPKQIKKTEVKIEEPIVSDIDKLMKEWAEIVNEEAIIDEAKGKIIKRKEAMITKLWDHLNKNPTDQVLIEKPVEKEPAAEKSKTPIKSKKTKAPEEVEEEHAPVVPVKKAPTKKAVVKTTEEEPAHEPSVATKKVATKKVSAKEETPVEEKPKVAPKKIAAPPKGAAKPKTSTEVEVKKLENDSSSDTDVESLSSVSSESEGSDGGED